VESVENYSVLYCGRVTFLNGVNFSSIDSARVQFSLVATYQNGEGND